MVRSDMGCACDHSGPFSFSVLTLSTYVRTSSLFILFPRALLYLLLPSFLTILLKWVPPFFSLFTVPFSSSILPFFVFLLYFTSGNQLPNCLLTSCKEGASVRPSTRPPVRHTVK